MIDFIKINDLSIGLAIKSLLPFPLFIEEGSGEILKRKQSTKLRNLVFTITPGNNSKVKFQGSIHKFANNGLHNYDPFTFTRFREMMEKLSDYISPGDQINLIEVGVNLHTPFDQRDFIRSLIAHKKRRVNITDRTGILFAEVKHSQYTLKIYDKGLQYGQGNILRIELRIEKMENLFPNGLKWIDLGNPETWRYMGARLIKSLKELLYFDPGIDLSAITSQRERDILNEGNNPIFWETLKDPHPERKRDQFQQLVRKYGSTFGNIITMVEEEVTSLINDNELQEMAVSDHFSLFRNDTSIPDSYKNLAFSDPLLSCQFPPLETRRRVCQVTGLDISNQKPGSRFLGYNGLRWLLKTDPDKFAELRDSRLSDKWFNSTLDIQIEKIAHSIRNEYFNPKHNATRDITKVLSYPALFDQIPYIRLDRLNLAGIRIENNNQKQSWQ